jgi:hypothetical protein
VGGNNRSGIAYDDNGTPPTDDDSLWILCHTCPNTVEQRPLSNPTQVARSFSLEAAFLRSGLALDPEDRTLWLYFRSSDLTVSQLEQYDQNGTRLSVVPLDPVNRTQPGVSGGEFQDRSYLEVTKTGSGAGTITSDPAAIACGPACAAAFASFPTGNVVTGEVITPSAVILTASPQGDALFDGWNGAGCSGTGPCQVSMSADRQVEARFVRAHRLTVMVTGSGSVASQPAGISCGGDCTSRWCVGPHAHARRSSPLERANTSTRRLGRRRRHGAGSCGQECVFTASNVVDGMRPANWTLVAPGRAGTVPAGWCRGAVDLRTAPVSLDS